MFTHFLNRFKSLNPYLQDIIRIIGWYILLQLVAYIYIGLVLPGGKFHLDLPHGFNLLSILETFIVRGTFILLDSLHYSVSIVRYNIIRIDHSFDVQVLHGCLGIYVMIAYLSLILGTRGVKKVLWIGLGLFFIQCINIGRISFLLLFHHRIPGIEYRIHDWINLISYGIIFTLFYLWFNNYSLHKKSPSV